MMDELIRAYVPDAEELDLPWEGLVRLAKLRDEVAAEQLELDFQEND